MPKFTAQEYTELNCLFVCFYYLLCTCYYQKETEQIDDINLKNQQVVVLLLLLLLELRMYITFEKILGGRNDLFNRIAPEGEAK